MADRRDTASMWSAVGTAGKALSVLLAGGAVAAVAGNGALAAFLIVAGVAGGALGVLVDARLKALERRGARAAAEEEQRQASVARERTLAEALRVEVCTVADVCVEDVGVDAVDPKVLARALRVEDDQLPYVARDVDGCLRDHLARASSGHGPALVCLYGEPKAGKSRSMLHALKAALPDAAIVAPHRTRENLQTILDSDLLQEAGDAHSGSLVLWLDDLEGFVRIGESGLDRKRVVRLKQQLPGLVVAATAGGRGLERRLGLSPTDLYEPLNELLDHGVTVELIRQLATPTERDALSAVVPPDLAAEMQSGLGAVAVSGRRLLQILRDKRHPGFEDGRVCAEGAAVTWAAVSAYRHGLVDPIADDVLRSLFECYWAAPMDDAFERALSWATKPVYGQVSLLRKYGRAYAPYDYLVRLAPASDPDAERCAWRVLLTSASADELFLLGSNAYERGLVDDAADALGRADERGHAGSAVNLGVLLLIERDDSEGAEGAFRRADERGDADGANNLGSILLGRGDADGAEAAFRRADERGHPASPGVLGVLLQARGDLDAAEAAFRRADERGDAQGASKLGALLHGRGDFDAAEAAFRRADERGDAEGASKLGALLHERGDFDAAEAAFRRSDERGDAEGAFNLGVLLRERGDIDGAEAAFHRADERGDAEGAHGLGVLFSDREDAHSAEAAFRRADDRESANGAFDLAILLGRRGDLDGAEAALHRADERGSADGAAKLGMLLEERSDLDAAEAAYRRADERGGAVGAGLLGVMLDERGDHEGAETAFRRADERGNAAGAYALGVQLGQRGDLDSAEAAFQRAAERGNAAGAYALAGLLEQRGDLQRAQALYRRASDMGDPEVAALAAEALQRLAS